MCNTKYHIRFSIILTLELLLFSYKPIAQIKSNDTITVQAIIQNGDTIPISVLSYVFVNCKLTEAQKRALIEYNRLRNAVYYTYPYARKAGSIMNDINNKISSIPDKRNQKKYIKSREAELRKEFTTPLTNMSVFQGKILMKLINRETGNSCYEIIKEYKGGLTAGVYQTVAFFFDTSLKQPYDPQNNDQTIERIVREIQRLYGYPDIAKSRN